VEALATSTGTVKVTIKTKMKIFGILGIKTKMKIFNILGIKTKIKIFLTRAGAGTGAGAGADHVEI
jgi:hypothetical protein